MKTLILSDTHLTERFNKRQFVYLQDIINSADKVIINGDFWDGFFTTFEKFLNSPWQKLFPLLKSKDLIYLPGNHDREQWLDDRVHLFAKECIPKTKLILDKCTLHIEHGDKIAPSLSALYPSLVDKRNYIVKGGFILESIGLNLLGPKPFVPFNYVSSQLKRWSLKNLDRGDILVCGHAHLAEFAPEQGYINTGILQHNLAQYLLVDNNNLQFINERF